MKRPPEISEDTWNRFHGSFRIETSPNTAAQDPRGRIIEELGRKVLDRESFLSIVDDLSSLAVSEGHQDIADGLNKIRKELTLSKKEYDPRWFELP